MGQKFEITYSPSNWTAPSGGIATTWASPYAGLNVQTPANLLDPASTPAMDNFMLRNTELRSRPQFRSYLPGPDGNPILGVASFLSKNGVWHTLAWTILGAYQLLFAAASRVQQGASPWVLLEGPTQNGASYVRWRSFQNIIYWSSNNGHLSAWDGASLTVINDAAFLGVGVAGLPPATTTLIGAQFIGELDNHLLLVSTTETPITAGVAGATIPFPQRVRWSNSGFNPNSGGVFGANLGTLGATFDPTINVNAGFQDFLEVPDIITGTMFIGRMGYIFRQNGVTEMSPTGNGTAPFDFNHLWASEQGIGNIYTTSVAQFGDIGIFVSVDNIYQMSSNGLQAIGRGARDAIISDLAATSSPPTAVIIPAYTLGYTYLAYKLFISMPNGDTRVYVFSIEDQNWSSWTLKNTTIGIPYKCWVGDLPVLVTTQQVVGGVPSGGGSGGGIIGGNGGLGHQGGPRKT